MNAENVYLKEIEDFEKPEFKDKIQESFGIAISENFENAPIVPSDKELEKAFNDIKNNVFFIYLNNEKIGGAVVKANNKTLRSSLELFFICKGKHSSGLGLRAWKAIEKQYPKTRIWETITPYFEKRNINFYVNKCGFHIVEFCNKYHRNKNYEHAEDDNIPGAEDFFRFEKNMQALQ